MSDEFKPRPGAKRSQALKIAVLGPENAGKSLSSLLLARGIVGPKGRIIAIDTQGGQIEEYVGHESVGNFDVIDLPAPYTPDRFNSALNSAIQSGADCIVVDSATHEWSGEGGVLEMAENSGKKGHQKWLIPKISHNRFVANILKSSVHVILCFRMKTSLNTQTNKKELSVIGNEELIYDMTLNFELDRESHTVKSAYLNDRYEGCIKRGQIITTVQGEALAGEASKGIVEPYSVELNELEQAARRGGSALKAAMDRLKHESFEAYTHHFTKPGFKDRLVEIALSADDANSTIGEDDFPGDVPVTSNGDLDL
jgi:hypothetical protein